jgi:hypothetical protein
MPLAHNVPPVKATPTGTPGQYKARLLLEMHGDWALRLKIAGPLRDQLTHVLRFGEAGSAPPVRKQGKPQGGGHRH